MKIYKIYKVGRGVNVPTKRFKICEICGNRILDFRLEVLNPNGTKTSYDVECIAGAYFKIKKKWYSKFLGI